MKRKNNVPKSARSQSLCEAEDNSHHCSDEPTKQGELSNPEKSPSAATVQTTAVQVGGTAVAGEPAGRNLPPHHLAPRAVESGAPEACSRCDGKGCVRCDGSGLRVRVRRPGRGGRELRRLLAALCDLALDPCPVHPTNYIEALHAGLGEGRWKPGCKCGESALVLVVNAAAGSLDGCSPADLDRLVTAEGAPWLSPSVYAVRSLCEGKVYEAGRHLPALAQTGTKAELLAALRRVRKAWAAGAKWAKYGRSTALLFSLDDVAKLVGEGAATELERRELVATVRCAANLGAPPAAASEPSTLFGGSR